MSDDIPSCDDGPDWTGLTVHWWPGLPRPGDVCSCGQRIYRPAPDGRWADEPNGLGVS